MCVCMCYYVHFGGERYKHASRSHMQRNCIKYLFYSKLLIFIIFEAEKGIAYIVNVVAVNPEKCVHICAMCNVHTSIFHVLHCTMFISCVYFEYGFNIAIIANRSFW